MVWKSEYMAQDSGSEELEHFGIPGMRWGVRKRRYGFDGPEQRINSERRERRNHYARVALGVGVAVGTVAVRGMMEHSRKEKLARDLVSQNMDYLSTMIPPNWKVH